MVCPQYEFSYACQDYLSLKMLFTLGALIWFLPSGNAPLHRVHWYGFSPIWVIISLSRLLFIENAFFSHRVHWYNFSPVWVILCWFRSLIRENAFSQRVHRYGFSPVWVIICGSRVLLCEMLSHTGYIYMFFLPEWASICWSGPLQLTQLGILKNFWKY